MTLYNNTPNQASTESVIQAARTADPRPESDRRVATVTTTRPNVTVSFRSNTNSAPNEYPPFSVTIRSLGRARP